MKHLILLLVCLSSMPLRAQRSIKIEKIDWQKCSMEIFNQDSTSQELIGPIGSNIKARKAETIVVKYVCEDSMTDEIMDGTLLHLAISNVNGFALSDTETSITIGGIKIATYAQAIYKAGIGVSFEINPISWNWKKGASFVFHLYNEEKEVKRKILVFN